MHYETEEVLKLWQPVTDVYNIIKSDPWRRRHLDEVNFPDRRRFINACADLAVLADPRGQLLLQSKINEGLSDHMAEEVALDIGKTVTYRFIESKVEVVPMLALDFMLLHLAVLEKRSAEEADGLMYSLSDKLCEAALIRREHFGIGVDCEKSFASWSPQARHDFLRPLVTLAFVEFGKFGFEDDRQIATAVANEDLHRGFRHLQHRSVEFEQEVRIALGQHLLELARDLKLMRLTDTALSFVLEYLDDQLRASNKKLLELLDGIESALKRQIRSKRDQEEAAAERELRSTD